MTKWTPEFLEKMRYVTDEVADDCVAKIIESHEVGAINNIMAHLMKNDDFEMPHIENEVQQKVQDYLDKTKQLPDWYDPNKARKGAELFNEYSISAIAALFCGALPTTYLAKRGASVLSGTKRLTKHVHRRLLETGQFIFDVTAENSFEKEGRAIVSCQKLRLLHASIRYYITHDNIWQVDFDQKELGKPINQEDLAATMLAFSVVVIDCLHKFELTPTEEQMEGYMHLWGVTGYMIGLHKDLIPANVAEGRNLLARYMKRQKGKSEQGRQLTHALLKFMDNLLPGRIFPDLAAAKMRLCLGDADAELLGIPAASWAEKRLELEEHVHEIDAEILHEVPGLSRPLAYYQHRLMQEFLILDRGGHRASFRIPPALKGNWTLADVKSDYPHRKNHPAPPPIAYDQEKKPWEMIFPPEPKQLPPPSPVQHPRFMPWLMFQSWDHCLFMHWPVDPDYLRPFVPEGMELDLYGGKAWITLIPLKMERIHLRFLPPIGFGTSNFGEINLRTYVRVDNKPGVYFFSIDADSGFSSWVARKFFLLPYIFSNIAFDEGNDEQSGKVVYSLNGDRPLSKPGDPAILNVSYKPTGAPFEPEKSSLEHFLVERYLLFTENRRGTILRGDVRHDHWKLQKVEVEIRENSILAAAGLNPPNLGDPHVYYSAGTNSKVWPTFPISWLRFIRQSIKATAAEVQAKPDKWSWLFAQKENHALFMYWSFDPEALQALLPPELELDLRDGKAWIGQIAYRVDDSHFHILPPIPYLRSFLEIDFFVLTKWRGQPGIYFLSLDSNQSLMPTLSRAIFSMPYRSSKMNLKDSIDGWLDMRSNRSESSYAKAADFGVRYRPSGTPKPAEEGTLAHFLVERYVLFQENRHGMIFEGIVEHAPWSITDEVEVDLEVNTIPEAAGITCSSDPICFFSPGVSMRAWPLRIFPFG